MKLNKLVKWYFLIIFIFKPRICHRTLSNKTSPCVQLTAFPSDKSYIHSNQFVSFFLSGPILVRSNAMTNGKYRGVTTCKKHLLWSIHTFLAGQMMAATKHSNAKAPLRIIGGCSFLAVQNSSIGDLVTHSLGQSGSLQSVSHWRYFYFWHIKSDPRDLWPLRHLIRVIRKHDLTTKITYLPSNLPIFLHLSDPRDLWPEKVHISAHLPTYLPAYLP